MLYTELTEQQNSSLEKKCILGDEAGCNSAFISENSRCQSLSVQVTKTTHLFLGTKASWNLTDNGQVHLTDNGQVHLTSNSGLDLYSPSAVAVHGLPDPRRGNSHAQWVVLRARHWEASCGIRCRRDPRKPESDLRGTNPALPGTSRATLGNPLPFTAKFSSPVNWG